ncbi:MAG: hypothetical protein LBU92_00935, partial [Prevotellaceae bacterium]|nr:hypothetical protein [Prevotellaceae bacterium]
GTFNPTTIWNVVLGGIPGIAIDAISGAIWQYNYPSVHAKLTPENYVQPAKNQVQPSKVEAGKNSKLKVAVLAPTATAEVPESIKSIVLEEVNSAVANAFGYTTLTSEPTNSASTDISQVSTFGKKIGADKVVLTHISKLGDAYHGSCKLVDVATSGIASQKTGKTVSGGANIDDVVIDMVVTMLRQD